jgi:small subunit ribosomal protein S17
MTSAKIEEARGFRKTREGIVTSDKMDKTVVVEIKNQVKQKS